MKKVAVVPYAKKPGVAQVVPDLIDWLVEHGIAVSMPQEEAAILNLQEFGVNDEQVFDQAELVITLGGDGTTLRAVRMMGRKSIPIVGVNLGEMGFLMWVQPEKMIAALEKIKDGRFEIEERRMLINQVKFDDGRVLERLALNDILIGRREFGRLIKLDVFINDVIYCRYAADGLVGATPTGSTAHAFSAGGPIIAPATDVYMIIPICTHSLNNRGLVLSANDSVKIQPAKPDPAIGISVDGMTIDTNTKVESVEINLADHKCRFINLDGPGFYQALGHRLEQWLSLM